MRSGAVVKELIFAAAALWPAAAAAGGPSSLIDARYDFVVDSRMGRIESCGILFRWGIGSDNKFFVIDGSVYSAFFQGRIPGAMFKFTVEEHLAKEIVPKKVVFARIKAGNATTDKFIRLQSDNNNAFLSAGNPQEGGESIFNIGFNLLSEETWVAFNIGDGRDYTFEVPTPTDLRVSGGYARCMNEAVQQVNSELGPGAQ